MHGGEGCPGGEYEGLHEGDGAGEAGAVGCECYGGRGEC